MGKKNKLTIKGVLNAEPKPGFKWDETCERIAGEIMDFRYSPFEDDAEKTEEEKEKASYEPFEEYIFFDVDDGGEFEVCFKAPKFYRRTSAQGKRFLKAIIKLARQLRMHCYDEDIFDEATLEKDEENNILNLSYIRRVEVEIED